jgi:predicted Zn-dependent protease
VTIFSFAWNWRFVRGYFEARESMRAIGAGDIEKASRLMTAASQHVPESRELGAMADMNKGLLLAKQDRPAEAVPLLRRARGAMPEARFLDLLILQCEMSMAFDAKDYDGFLTKARAIHQAMGDKAVVLGSLASAYACKYAVTGDESFRKQALEQLRLAGQAKDRDPKEQAELEQRILHRLETREIIDRKEFRKRFPDGWKKDGPKADKENPA